MRRRLAVEILVWGSRAAATAWLVLSVRVPAFAQGSYEIQVYPSELMKPRTTMFEFHSNYTPDGVRTTPDGTQPNHHAFHETLEITHGFTDWLEVGLYEFTSYHPGDGYQWVGMHLRPRIGVPKSWDWPVGLSVSQEIGYQRPAFSTDAWTWEIRPIIDQELGRFYWSANAAFELPIGPGSDGKPVAFSSAVKLGYQLTGKVSAGLEYYGELGPVSHPDPARDQGHQIFPCIDLDVSPDWELNAGVGIGLTPASDPLVIKVIVGRRFKF